ncbi:MAG: hypothetical protein V3R68_00270, partial [Gammaproteobacteria bacterium]
VYPMGDAAPWDDIENNSVKVRIRNDHITMNAINDRTDCLFFSITILTGRLKCAGRLMIFRSVRNHFWFFICIGGTQKRHVNCV